MSMFIANLATFPVSMTSREIAELTGKQHAHIMRDIRAMIERLEADPNLDWHCETEAYLDEQGKVREMYRLDKDTTMCLVTGYDPIPRMRIIHRWQELEAQAAAPALNPTNLSRLQLIEIAMQAEQERLALEHKVAEIQPKADALDRIATASDGAMCLRDTAKALQIRPIDLIRWMLVHQWVYRRNGNKNLIAYQDKIHQGLLEHKVHVSRDETGIERVHEQAMVTPKGLAKLAAIHQAQLPLTVEAA